MLTTLPPAKGNRMHHLRVYRCGQDSGDMGALHCAGVNLPDGDCVNVFEQITVADVRAIPSMKDVPPDGIFLDWPKMSMHQVFRCLHFVRCQGRCLRSNGPDNAASAQLENVSWKPGFDESRMDYDHIGLTDEFPAEYGGRPRVPKPLPAPRNFAAKAVAYDRVALAWDAPTHPAGANVVYAVFRDGKKIATTRARRYVDDDLAELTTYRYGVAAKCGDFVHWGARAKTQIHTPADRVGPKLTGARIQPGSQRVRVAFDEPVDPASAQRPDGYRFDPPVRVLSVKQLFPQSVELEVAGLRPGASYTISAVGVRDHNAARNACDPRHSVAVGVGKIIVWYPMKRLRPGRLVDESGGGADAVLHGGAAIEPRGGPFGGPALRLDGETGYAEAPADLNLGAGDFTIMAWIYKEKAGIVLSKGNGFGSPRQWSWGWQKVPRSISLRVNNRFLSSAPESAPYLRWVWTVFVKRGNVGRAYIDGRPSGEAYDMSGLGPFVNDFPLRIGRRDYKPTPMFFQGKIADVKLLNYALTPEEIRAAAKRPTR